jgi:two-component system NtrC family response regulator
MKYKILIVEDNEALRRQLKWTIGGNYTILEAEDRDSAFLRLRERPDIVLLDLHLPPEPESPKCGIEVFERMKSLTHPSLVIVITGDEDRQLAYRLIEEGVFDYLIKPIDFDELNVILKRALSRIQLEREISLLRRELLSGMRYEDLIGKSPEMKRIFDEIERVAPTDANILILGESGTGKELVARAIHRRSKRRKNPFIPVDCAAIPENLIESELFGYEKGAFTGASKSKPGRFELADGGTLFFDEVGNLPLSTQVKLLRFLQEREIFRLGGKNPIKLDVRVVAASNQNLEELCEKKLFREDLFFRLNTITIKIPPLRERREDIPLLAEHFLRKYSKLYGKGIKSFSEKALLLLLEYEWPGNVRELEHTVERAVVLSSGSWIKPEDIEFTKLKTQREERLSLPIDLKETLSNLEREMVEKALKEAGGNREKASELLKIDLHQLKYLIKKYKIGRE